jgi:hypothetical protein
MDARRTSRLVTAALVTIAISMLVLTDCSPGIDNGPDPDRKLVTQNGVERAINAAPG